MDSYGHLRRIGPERLANKARVFQEERKIQISLLKVIHTDLRKNEIRKYDIGYREVFRGD